MSRLKTIMIIHTAMGISVLVVGGVMYYLIEGGLAPEAGGMPDFMIYLPPVFLVIVLMVSRVVFSNQINGIDSTTTLKQKLEKFFVGHIIRVALFEAAGIFAAVISFITGNNLNMIVVLVVVLFFYMIRPSVNRIVIDLNLTAAERDELEKL